MLRPAVRRAPVSWTSAVVGWVGSVVLAMPAAYLLGVWFSGWEEPPSYIVQGASRDPMLSGAGTAISLTFAGLVLLVTVVWGRELRHALAAQRDLAGRATARADETRCASPRRSG